MFAEIRNDYEFEEIENGIKRGITIDAWKTDDDNESGQIVATVILTKHDDIVVVWNDNSARMDEAVKEYIENAKFRLLKFIIESTK